MSLLRAVRARLLDRIVLLDAVVHTARRAWRPGSSRCARHSLTHEIIYDEKLTSRRRRASSWTRRRARRTSTSRKSSSSAPRRSARTRILLNSKSPRFPNGLGNSSGVVGQNLMDHHFLVGASGAIEGLLDHYYEGNRPNGIYIPRFRNLAATNSEEPKFVRGFGYQGGAGARRMGTRRVGSRASASS